MRVDLCRMQIPFPGVHGAPGSERWRLQDKCGCWEWGPGSLADSWERSHQGTWAPHWERYLKISIDYNGLNYATITMNAVNQIQLKTIKVYFHHVSKYYELKKSFWSSRTLTDLPECIPVMKRPKMTIAGILQALLKPIRAPPRNTSKVDLTTVPFLFGSTFYSFNQ